MLHEPGRIDPVEKVSVETRPGASDRRQKRQNRTGRKLVTDNDRRRRRRDLNVFLGDAYRVRAVGENDGRHYA
jgi:hypothetical protein